MNARTYIDSELARIGDFGPKMQPESIKEVYEGDRLVGCLVVTKTSSCLIKTWTPDCGTVYMIEKNPALSPSWRYEPVGTYKEPGYLL